MVCISMTFEIAPPPPFQHHHVTPFPSSSDIGFYKFLINMPLIPILHPM